MRIEKVVVSVTVENKVITFTFDDPAKLERLIAERSTLGEAVREAVRRTALK